MTDKEFKEKHNLKCTRSGIKEMKKMSKVRLRLALDKLEEPSKRIKIVWISHNTTGE